MSEELRNLKAERARMADRLSDLQKAMATLDAIGHEVEGEIQAKDLQIQALIVEGDREEAK